MGYFDGLIDASFKTDSEGHLLYYRWGVIGKGYILADDQKKQEVRRFVKLYYIVSLSAIITVGAVIGWIFTIALLPFIFAWYCFATARLLKGLPISSTRLSLRESYTSSAKSNSVRTLWLMLISSTVFVLGGFVVIFFNKDAWFIGLASIVFFGVGALVFAYMIKVKKHLT